ncbi:MAG: SDR family oxidoreductase [Gammaproteobacteria bacterium]|nr:SDR family oxidoreductase [Gammaproteobacteria bacterium]MDH4254543.1 SDR family oxidoreductase [Gammaproteobacteria bacterium]MDH5310393.1 SDR family oxidoreductase [Gammaproteobacteria bacterium]
MDLGLTGKKALVLASSKGLGLGIAARLCAEGADVLLCGRGRDRLEAAAASLNSRGPGSADYVVTDLGEPESAEALHAAAMDRFGAVDVLVNNTGGPPPGGVEGQALETWSSQFDTMVLRVIDITGRCLPGMRARGWGRVLTVASSGIIQPIPNLALSNTLRSALVGWSKSLSAEVAAAGITVNILAPGRIHTERTDELDGAVAKRSGKTLEEVMAAASATIPAGRYGRVDEFAAVAAFLVSEPASYVTGGIVRCDGGLIRSV